MADIRPSENLSRTLNNDVIKTNPFGQNSLGEKVYARAERLAAALHLLTNHVPESEPARSRLRGGALALISDVLALRDNMRAPNSHNINRVYARIRELISLVRILSVSGYISAQNTEVIVSGLDDLNNFLISSQRSTLSETVTLTKEELIGGPLVKDVMSIKDVRDVLTPVKDRERTLKDVPRLGSVDSDARSEKIIQILKTNGQVGIKDISASLPEYSEKMIQRQLSYLSKVGRVKKLGFKRWSKYILTEMVSSGASS